MIYFDNSATTKPYSEVLRSFVKVAEHFFANPSSLHSLGGEAEHLLTESRSIVARLLRVKPSEIVFTSGGTEGNNIAIKGAAMHRRSRGRHIITTSVEHASVLEACKQLESFGFDITYLPVNKSGVISIEQLKKVIRDDTILVSIQHVNNETGAIQPIQEIGALLHQYPKILFHVDHVQGIGHVPLSFRESYVDLCTMSGHKFHSVKGTGILYIREGVVIDPLLSGGQQENYVRSGTENLPGIVAMTKALRMTLEKQMESTQRIKKIKDRLYSFFETMDNVTINSPYLSSSHILNVSLLGYKPEVIIHALEKHDVYVSTKSACSSKEKEASHVLLQMGCSQPIAESAIRLSFSQQNTIEEAEKFEQIFLETLEKLYEVMR